MSGAQAAALLANNAGTLMPPRANLWGWWKVDGGSYSETSGTPATPVTVNGTSIGSLLDLSGNGNHLYQATAGKKPVYTTGEINGYAAASFTAASTQYFATTGVPSPDTVISGFFVVNASTWQSVGPIFGNSTTGNPTYDVLQTTSSPLIALYNGHYGSTTSMSLSAWHFVAGIINGTSSSILQVDDNAAVTGAIAGGGGGTQMLMGGDTGNGKYFNGYEAEALIYTAALDPASGNGAAVKAYLNAKYALGL